MKTKIIVVLLVGTVLLAATPSFSYAGHHYGGGYWAGPLIGGLLAGAIIGSALSQPHYVAAPQPVCVYPQPVRFHAVPAPVCGPAYVGAVPRGEWVLVPGRWLHGQWILAHRVWVR